MTTILRARARSEPSYSMVAASRLRAGTRMNRPAMQDIAVQTHTSYSELDTSRKIRHRNKVYYRVLHWPIWIFVFFIVPGPLTFDLFERGFDWRTTAWLSIVVAATRIAAARG